MDDGSTHDDCEKWLKTYNTLTYRNSLFFKRPLLYSTTNFVEHSDIKRTSTPNIFKKKVKKVILDCQGEGETIEWEVDNFALYKCKGLQRAGSNKRNKETVRYAQFFLNKTNYSTTAEKTCKTVKARIYKIHFARKIG